MARRKAKAAAPLVVRCEEHGKERFGSRVAAVSALARHALSRSERVPVRAYKDRECGWWHLTSRPGAGRGGPV